MTNKIFMSMVVALCWTFSVVRADDVIEARKAFDLFVQYQKTDDERILDLFARDISVTLTFDTGKETRDMVLPADTFRGLVKEGIAKKDGNTDMYEDIKFTQEGDTVKLTCTLVDGKTGKRGPFVAVYGNDASGAFKLKAMKLNVPVPQLPPE